MLNELLKLKVLAAAAVAVTGLVIAPSAARAGGHVSIGIGFGGSYPAPYYQPAYCGPTVTYVSPRITYYTPAPTYYATPAPAVVYSPAPVYYSTPTYYPTTTYYYSRPRYYSPFSFSLGFGFSGRRHW